MPYSGDPSSSDIDEVRFWLQDTGDPSLLQDAEIRYYIDKATGYTSDAILLAAGLCTVIMAKYASALAIEGDGITYDPGQLQNKYQQLAASLKAQWEQLNANTGGPWAGGVSWWNETFFGTKPPTFALGQRDNIRAGNQFQENRHFNLEYDDYDPDPADYQTG